jgi:hypothetical protein
MSHHRLAALFVALAVLHPPAAEAQQAERVLACDGAFARDSSHARLVQAFGKSSVAVEEIESEKGVKTKVSVIYPYDSHRRVEVFWHDDQTQSRPETIRVDFRSNWRAVRGLRIGLELPDVEKINGKPFRMMGFDWELGGRVSNWQAGVLAKIPGGCELRLGFEAWADAPEASRDKVSGEKEFLSTDPDMRASKPTVTQIIISYRP